MEQGSPVRVRTQALPDAVAPGGRPLPSPKWLKKARPARDRPRWLGRAAHPALDSANPAAEVRPLNGSSIWGLHSARVVRKMHRKAWCPHRCEEEEEDEDRTERAVLSSGGLTPSRWTLTHFTDEETER